jgi:hypothetical protein
MEWGRAPGPLSLARRGNSDCEMWPPVIAREVANPRSAQFLLRFHLRETHQHCQSLYFFLL